MLQIRRDTYMDEVTGEPTTGIDEVAAATTRFPNRAMDDESRLRHAQ